MGDNGTAPATMYVHFISRVLLLINLPALFSYAFDVDSESHAFKNRRVLAYVDAGVPDGIQIDTEGICIYSSIDCVLTENVGNIYSGCADGTQVSDLFIV